ncbi:integral membrane protein [Streptomyces zinciresistens K42]|uniref:Integral membrane protein n=1 Tax=Streptomyces zinciresistens K42 TaxID=700597 RepID=G2G9P7_9ACTN|nr:hypothetical protein [Streptomyces zinciresistens]EGX59826.1 integral membrane protein [Streptomyces zinciresistens K42]
MGIESDQVVYEYLSRVGDVAQQRQLPSSTRMRLVNDLRGEIDRRRAGTPVDSPAAVRRIIAHLGTPDDVVTAAGGGAAPAPRTPAAPVPAQPVGRDHDTAAERPKGLRRLVPRPRRAEPETADDAPAPPHLAATRDPADGTRRADWWRVDSTPFGPGEDVPGFVGGVEIPEMLRHPPAQDNPRPPAEQKPAEPAPAPVEKAAAPGAPRLRRLLGRRPAGTGTRWTNPLLLLAAALLVAGAALGNLVVLLLGWLIAWASRRLSAAETKWAVVILPGLSLTAGAVWLWGRTAGRWGDPVADGRTGAALAETWPWVLRGAAVASALFLVWRSQRRR